MARLTPLQALGATAGVVALALALSGCTGLYNTVEKKVHTAVVNAGKPRTGECWASTFDDAESAADWKGGPAVDCDGTHQLYTFGVPELEDQHPGKLFDSSGKLDEGVWDDAYTTCTDEETNAFPQPDDTAQLLDLEPYLPTEAIWNSGARWVRCDLGVLAVGSSVADPEFAPLPPDIRSLSDDITAAPEQFDFCVNDPGGVSSGEPKGPDAVYADCRDNPDWTLAGYDYMDGVHGPYPGMAGIQKIYETQCKARYADKTHVTYAYYPSEKSWDQGDQTIECWVGRK